MTDGRWIVEDVVERRRFKLSAPAAAALVAATRPQSRDELVDRLVSLDGDRPAERWAAVVDDLRARRLIVDTASAATNPRVSWAARVRREWSRYGWDEAAEYHVLSFDYPCVDYSEGVAYLADRARMLGYQASEPDVDRCKLDYLDRPETPLPPPAPDLADGTVTDVWGAGVEPRPADLDRVARAVALGFGQTGEIVPRTDAAPLLQRTSPSGGGRNPSEGYLVVRSLPGAEPGWYHVTMRPFGLRRLDGPPIGDDELRSRFPETLHRSPFDVRALVVVTCVFERNMYRYREPRTFRTVHMDAGHIAATLRMAGRALGLSVAVYTCDDAGSVEAALGLDGMREGYMLTVAVGDGQPGAAPAERG